MKILRATICYLCLAVLFTTFTFAQNTPETAENYYNQGVRELKRKNYEFAIELLSISLDILPNYKDALLARSKAFQNIHKYQRNALADINKVIELDSSFGEAYFERAEIRKLLLHRQGSNVDKIPQSQIDEINNLILKDFDSAIRNNFKTLDVYIKRADLKCNILDRCGEAIADYTAALVFEPNNENIVLSRSIAKFRNKQAEPAIVDIEKFANTQNSGLENPNTESGALSLVEKLRKMQANDFALFFISRAIERNPVKGELYFIRAMIRRGLFSEMLRKVGSMRLEDTFQYKKPILSDIDSALKYGYETVEVYMMRADTKCRSLQMCKEAIDDYDAALLLKPLDEDILYQRANAKYKNSDLDGAIADLDIIINGLSNPKPTDSNRPAPINKVESDKFKLSVTIVNMGAFLSQKGDSDFALIMFDRAIKLVPEHPFAFNARGQHKLIFGDISQAIQDFTKSIEINSKSKQKRILFSPYLNRGIANYLLGNSEQAQKDFDAAFEIMPHLTNSKDFRLEMVKRQREQKIIRVDMSDFKRNNN